MRDERNFRKSDASIESRRIAKNAVFDKAINTLADANKVGFDFLTETERDLIGFVCGMLERKKG